MVVHILEVARGQDGVVLHSQLQKAVHLVAVHGPVAGQQMQQQVALAQEVPHKYDIVAAGSLATVHSHRMQVVHGLQAMQCTLSHVIGYGFSASVSAHDLDAQQGCEESQRMRK